MTAKHADTKASFEAAWPAFEAVIRNANNAEPDTSDSHIESEADQLARYQLSSESRTLLVAASESDGTIMAVTSNYGFDLHVDQQDYTNNATPRVRAIWKRALQDLERHGLVEAASAEKEIFDLTALGYEVADVIKNNRPA